MHVLVYIYSRLKVFEYLISAWRPTIGVPGVCSAPSNIPVDIILENFWSRWRESTNHWEEHLLLMSQSQAAILVLCPVMRNDSDWLCDFFPVLPFLLDSYKNDCMTMRRSLVPLLDRVAMLDGNYTTWRLRYWLFTSSILAIICLFDRAALA